MKKIMKKARQYESKSSLNGKMKHLKGNACQKPKLKIKKR